MLTNNLQVQEKRNSRQKFKAKARKKIELNWIWSILFILAIAMFITFTTFYLQPGSFKSVLRLINQQPLVLVLNYLPVLLVLCMMYFIMNNVFYAGAVTSFVFNICSLINRLKIELRDDPFVPRDIQLVKEALNSVSDFKVKIKYYLVALIIIAVIMFLIANLIFEAKRLSAHKRIIGSIIVILGALLANNYIYSSKIIHYRKLHVSNRSYTPRVFQELGFTYCFLYNLNTHLIEEPENFSKKQVEDLIKANKALEATEPTVKPHVIFLMNEAFSDIGMDKVFDYDETNNPYKYWKEIIQDENSIAGHIVVPGFGGGTANTEFDIMTGMQTNMLSSVATSAFRAVGKNTQTIARIFSNSGYQTLFMHPGDRWFYNRYSVYKYFGIDETIFREAFSKEEKKGNMISDDALTEHIIEQFELHTKDPSKGPLFTYITSIQNHMPYIDRKYGDLVIEEIPLNKEITQEAKTYLSVYMEGIRDANKMIKDLTNYFDSQDEPVILVFFGDHLPNLGDNYLAYKALGLNIGDETSIENVINTYSTPYVIWSNNEAARMINLKEKQKELELPEDHRISVNYLGAMILELLGYKGQDPFIDYLNEIRKEVPVIFKGNYEVTDEGYTKDLDEYDQTIVDNLKHWEYYKMKYEQVK